MTALADELRRMTLDERTELICGALARGKAAEMDRLHAAHLEALGAGDAFAERLALIGRAPERDAAEAFCDRLVV